MPGALIVRVWWLVVVLLRVARRRLWWAVAWLLAALRLTRRGVRGACLRGSRGPSLGGPWPVVDGRDLRGRLICRCVGKVGRWWCDCGYSSSCQGCWLVVGHEDGISMFQDVCQLPPAQSQAGHSRLDILWQFFTPHGRNNSLHTAVVFQGRVVWAQECNETFRQL